VVELFLTRRQDRDDAFWVLGDHYSFKISSQETAGSLAVIEVTSFPKNGPPPHIHHHEDEAFYILEGTFSVLLGGRSFEVSAGDFVHVPKDTLHTYKNIGSGRGRFLVILTPGGFENLWREIGERARQDTLPMPALDGMLEKLIALAPQYHLEIPSAS
jgi:mannose-6-phosphate isomerase-like protein (cupin superfamily)